MGSDAKVGKFIAWPTPQRRRGRPSPRRISAPGRNADRRLLGTQFRRARSFPKYNHRCTEGSLSSAHDSPVAEEIPGANADIVMGLDGEGWSPIVGHLVMIRTGAARFLDHGSSNPLGSNKPIDLEARACIPRNRAGPRRRYGPIGVRGWPRRRCGGAIAPAEGRDTGRSKEQDQKDVSPRINTIIKYKVREGLVIYISLYNVIICIIDFPVQH